MAFSSRVVWPRGAVATGLVAIGALVVSGGCAKISSPVGGEPDREPPVVVGTVPGPYEVVPGLDRAVVVRFDERISERRIGESVLVSPETGAVRVKKGRSELRVSLEGGWRPGQVYRVVVLPVIQDLFNNTLEQEFELIFSTGPEIPATVVAGVLDDRISGEVVRGARVEALHSADSVVHLALSDSAGFFALRHIPPGSYELRAYEDRNRNRRPDYGEPLARAELTLSAADTIIGSYSLLAADTTPARVVRAESRDSMQVRLFLDDFMDPLEGLSGVEVELRELPDSVLIAGARVVHLHEFERRRAEERAAADSVDAAADLVGVAADSVRAAVDSARVVTERAGAAALESEPLPTRELVVVPVVPLRPQTRYVVEIRGVRNINGVGGGGGVAVFETAAAAPPPTPDEGA